MKNILVIILVVLTKSLLGQIVTIKDSLLNTFIENISISSKDQGVVSNQNGIADISVFNNDDLLEISHISYYNKKITKKNISNVVYLKQKTNMLPLVVLIETIKVPLSEKYPVFTIKPTGLSLIESSTANLISSQSSVIIQESQSGGGSLNYRGMEANRLLLIIDGITLNNAIYRSGHLQSSATINPFFIQSISLLSGPASICYGNGAMGGALIFNTHDPASENRFFFDQQFESSSNTVITSGRATYYRKKNSHMTAFSLKSADNLKMGINRFHGYEKWGDEEGATNINEQLNTNYDQADFIHKSNYMINEKSNVIINSQYTRSSNIYRFDKMNDIKNGMPKYDKWYYGPQIRFMQSINYKSNYKTGLYDNLKTVLAFQNVKESRHTQFFGSQLLNNRMENVRIYDYNIDLNKSIQSLMLSYGLGERKQDVYSTANLSDGETNSYNTTRYPDGGSKVNDFFAYAQANFPVNKKIDLVIGGRWNGRKLQAKFNNPTFSFHDIENNNTSFVKSILLSYKPLDKTSFNFSYYGGFRNPNVDDIGKIFSKNDVNVVVPNTSLEPEYANNFELAFNYFLSPINIAIQLFNTEITNAIIREYGTLNGSDSMLYDGNMMRIQMNKNIENSNIKGVSILTNIYASNNLKVTAKLNYLKGETNEKKPLSHIPPLNTKLAFNYQLKKSILDFYINYNAWKLAKDFDEAGVDNLEEAISEGIPSWYTLNLIYHKKIDRHITFTFAIRNILDAHYKTFGSGISASGRNIVVAVNTTF